MTTERALEILEQLWDGTDPVTGEILPDEHTVCRPEVMRALGVAMEALRRQNMPVANVNAGRAWTDDERVQLLHLYHQGESMDTICGILRRRERGVRRQLILLGAMEQPEKPVTEGRENAGKAWTKEDDERLRDMFTQRILVRNMANELRRSPYAIFCHLKKLGLFADFSGYPKDFEDECHFE